MRCGGRFKVNHLISSGVAILLGQVSAGAPIVARHGVVVEFERVGRDDRRRCKVRPALQYIDHRRIDLDRRDGRTGFDQCGGQRTGARPDFDGEAAPAGDAECGDPARSRCIGEKMLTEPLLGPNAARGEKGPWMQLNATRTR